MTVNISRVIIHRISAYSRHLLLLAAKIIIKLAEQYMQ